MRFLLLIIILNMPVKGFTQNITVIKAGSRSALIKEGEDLRTNWTLSPELKPDVYLCSKTTGMKYIHFYTDSDSLNISLKAGDVFEFIVLLKEKDSCRTRIECPTLPDFSSIRPEQHDTIPFELTDYNNIKLKVVLDGKDTLNLKFDSGTRDFLLTRETLKDKLHIQNLGGHHFKIGNCTWENQAIYPVELSGHGTEGRFGWNLFDGKLVEIDYEKRIFIIHSRLARIGKGFDKFTIDYVGGLFCIQGDLEVKKKKYRNKFLFDSGYQRTIMLDADLMREQNFPKDSLDVLKKVVMKNGQGEEIPVLTVHLEKLKLAEANLQDIPVQLLSQENPAGFQVHILGNEILKRFNTILDFQTNVVYLKPNKLFNQSYAEQGKKGS